MRYEMEMCKMRYEMEMCKTKMKIRRIADVEMWRYEMN